MGGGGIDGGRRRGRVRRQVSRDSGSRDLSIVLHNLKYLDEGVADHLPIFAVGLVAAVALRPRTMLLNMRGF